MIPKGGEGNIMMIGPAPDLDQDQEQDQDQDLDLDKGHNPDLKLGLDLDLDKGHNPDLKLGLDLDLGKKFKLKSRSCSTWIYDIYSLVLKRTHTFIGTLFFTPNTQDKFENVRIR